MVDPYAFFSLRTPPLRYFSNLIFLIECTVENGAVLGFTANENFLEKSKISHFFAKMNFAKTMRNFGIDKIKYATNAKILVIFAKFCINLFCKKCKILRHRLNREMRNFRETISP